MSTTALLLEEFISNSTTNLLRKYDQLLLNSVDDGSNIIRANTSKVILVPTNEEVATDSSDVGTAYYRLANVKIFVPITGGQGVDDAFAALLAIHQFHHELETTQDGCNVRLSADVIDTALSPMQAVQQLNRIFQESDASDNDENIQQQQPQQPPVTAILGGFRSAVTAPMAILSGLEEVVQISHASTAIEFDVKEQYPYLGRMVPSALGEATVAVDFLETYVHSTHIAIIFVADAFGSSLEQAVTQIATERGIVTQAYAIPLQINGNDDMTSIRDVMQQLKGSDMKHIYAICGETQLGSWLLAANDTGLMSDEYFWFFTGVDMDSIAGQNSESTETTRRLLNGASILQMQGGISPSKIREHSYVDPNSHGYHKFLDIWSQSLADLDFVSYVKSKLGYSSDDSENIQFASQPGSMRPFMFDAAIVLGRSLCAAENANGTQFVTGSEIFDAFRNKVSFSQGASGEVQIDDETGSRDYKGVHFVVWNVQESNDTINTTFVPALQHVQSRWHSIENRSLYFRDGTLTPPDSLGEVSIDFHYLGRSARIVGYTLTGVVGMSVFLVFLWTYNSRDHPVIRRSNLTFLCTICIGALFCALSIIFFGMDDSTTDDQAMLDASCKTGPALYFAGLSILLGPLLSKTHALYKVFLNPDKTHLEYSGRDVAKYSTLLLSINVIVFTIWYSVFPLQWNREFTGARDRYGRPIESFGRCQGDNAYVFYTILLVCNACIILVSIFLSFRARNIETEYEESICVSIAQVMILQLWCVGLPLLFALRDDNPQGMFIIEAIIIFLTSIGVLLLIYLPKYNLVRKERIIRMNRQSKKSTSLTTSNHVTTDCNREIQQSNDDDDDQDESMIKFHTCSSVILSCEDGNDDDSSESSSPLTRMATKVGPFLADSIMEPLSSSKDNKISATSFDPRLLSSSNKTEEEDDDDDNYTDTDHVNVTEWPLQAVTNSSSS